MALEWYEYGDVSRTKGRYGKGSIAPLTGELECPQARPHCLAVVNPFTLLMDERSQEDDGK